MNDSISINTALCLSSSDVAALSKGRMIAALSRTYINSIQQFALCSVEEQNSDSTISTGHWAKLEFCKIYTDPDDVRKLSQLTIWSNDDLQNLLKERYKLFLLCLRVFQIPQAIELPIGNVNTSKLGGFIKLPKSLFVNHSVPVLDNDLFLQRKQQLIHLKAPEYPELEELHETVNRLESSIENSNDFLDFIQSFLGWANKKPGSKIAQVPDWISQVSKLGNRSIEETEGKKSNYHAGSDFEDIVHRSLAFLGFQVDDNHQGGAGGLDLFCSAPYPLVGECKCGKSIPGNTVYELDNLTDDHFDDFSDGEIVKLIIGPGKPTPQLQKRAQKHQISIISPMFLQKLVELQAKYPGSIDLIELKQYLEPGQIDDKIEEYITKVLQKIRLRANIVEAVKRLSEMEPERQQFEVSEVRVQYNVLFCKLNGNTLDNEMVHEILIELSSPLAGYLGRLRGTSLQSDRFYFLRDMPDVDLSQP